MNRATSLYLKKTKLFLIYFRPSAGSLRSDDSDRPLACR
jgi:hypothetical protein